MSPPQVSGSLKRNCRFAFYCLCLKPIPFLLMTPGGAHRSVWKIIRQPEDCKTSPWLSPQKEGTADRGSGFKPRLLLGIRECLEWIQRLSCLPTTCGRTVGPISVIMYVTLDVWNTQRIPSGKSVSTAPLSVVRSISRAPGVGQHSPPVHTHHSGFSCGVTFESFRKRAVYFSHFCCSLLSQVRFFATP